MSGECFIEGFRETLRREDRPAFDALVALAKPYMCGRSFTSAADAFRTLVFSVLIELHKIAITNQDNINGLLARTLALEHGSLSAPPRTPDSPARAL
jgi:hypothetical protein